MLRVFAGRLGVAGGPRGGGADYLRTRALATAAQSRRESHWGPTNLQRGHAAPLSVRTQQSSKRGRARRVHSG
eukprot:6316211-Prymnesium_polylepis.1